MVKKEIQMPDKQTQDSIKNDTEAISAIKNNTDDISKIRNDIGDLYEQFLFSGGIKSVQSGIDEVEAGSSSVVYGRYEDSFSISSIDRSKSFLILQTFPTENHGKADNRASSEPIVGSLGSSSISITFNTTSPLKVHWQVVEFN